MTDKSKAGPPLNKREALKRTRNVYSRTFDTHDQQRRGFLVRVFGVMGGAIAAVFGSSSSAAAGRSPRADVAIAAARQYASEAKTRESIRRHASELLAVLAGRGAIDTKTVSVFPLGEIKPVKAYVNSAEGTYVAATAVSSTPRVKIQTKRTLPDGRTFELVVKPTAGRSRAILYDESDTIVNSYVHEAGSGGDVGTTFECQDCSDKRYECGIECSPDGQCSCVEYMIVENCIDPDCFGCHTDGYECTCGEDDYNC